MKLNRRDFLKGGLAGLFTGLLAWLGVLKAEEPQEEDDTAKLVALPDCPVEIYVGPVHCQEEPEKPIKPEGGKTWFIHWTEGEDGPDRGLSPDKPLATEAYALAQCSAPQGDMIFVLPGDGMMWHNYYDTEPEECWPNTQQSVYASYDGGDTWKETTLEDFLDEDSGQDDQEIFTIDGHKLTRDQYLFVQSLLTPESIDCAPGPAVVDSVDWRYFDGEEWHPLPELL